MVSMHAIPHSVSSAPHIPESEELLALVSLCEPLPLGLLVVVPVALAEVSVPGPALVGDDVAESLPVEASLSDPSEADAELDPSGVEPQLSGARAKMPVMRRRQALRIRSP